MKRTIGILAIVYGLCLSGYFGWWALKDNAALEAAVRANAPHAELRHRINVTAEGIWFLLSNLVILHGVSLASTQDRKA